MSTKACIIIKISDEDKGQTKKFDASKLPVKLKEWNEWGDEVDIEKSKPIKLGDDFMGIYVHWDGDNVINALNEKFNNYDSALNLVLGGFCSFIEYGGVRHYANRKGEEWKYIKPIKGRCIGTIIHKIGQPYNWYFNGEKWIELDNYIIVK